MKYLRLSATLLLALLGFAIFAFSTGYLNKGLFLSKLSLRQELQAVPTQKRIRVSSNPIVLSKACEQAQEIQLNFLRPKLGPEVYYVNILIDDVLYVEREIGEAQWLRKSGNASVHSNAVWLSFTMPSFAADKPTTRNVRVEFYEGQHLLEASDIPLLYVEEGEVVPVIHKNDQFFLSSCRVEPFQDSMASPTLAVGEYTTNMRCTRTIARKADHYQVDYVWSGNDVYERGGMQRVFELPVIESQQMQIPLGYELTEGVKEMPSLGWYTIKEEWVGKRFGYKMGTEVIGYKQDVKYVDCELVVVNESCIALPSRFSLALVD